MDADKHRKLFAAHLHSCGSNAAAFRRICSIIYPHCCTGWVCGAQQSACTQIQTQCTRQRLTSTTQNGSASAPLPPVPPRPAPLAPKTSITPQPQRPTPCVVTAQPPPLTRHPPPHQAAARRHARRAMAAMRVDTHGPDACAAASTARRARAPRPRPCCVLRWNHTLASCHLECCDGYCMRQRGSRARLSPPPRARKTRRLGGGWIAAAADPRMRGTQAGGVAGMRTQSATTPE